MKYSVCSVLAAFIGSIGADTTTDEGSDAYADYYKQYYEAQQAYNDIPTHLQQTAQDKQTFLGDFFLSQETSVRAVVLTNRGGTIDITHAAVIIFFQAFGFSFHNLIPITCLSTDCINACFTRSWNHRPPRYPQQ